MVLRGMVKNLRFGVTVAFLLMAAGAYAGEPRSALWAPRDGFGSLDDVLNTEITIATAKPVLAPEAPSVVSVVTKEEIELSGARTVVEVLRLLPGVDFGVDIWNTLGIGFRGLWGMEGKVKLSIDGVGQNEYMYGNVSFNNNFPVEMIEKIEVIRGPGSARFGNFSELAVINIVTKIGAELPGFQATSTTGLFDGSFARQQLSAREGFTFGSDGYVGLVLSEARDQRSDRDYVDTAGQRWRMRDDSQTRTRRIDANLRNGGFSGRFMYHDARTAFRDGTGDLLPTDEFVSFTAYTGQLSYAANVTNDLRVTPSFRFNLQQPWRNRSVPLDDAFYYDPTVRVYTYGVLADLDVSGSLSTQLGAEYETQRAKYGGSEPQRKYKFPGGGSSYDLYSYALFNEWFLKTSLVNVTAGLRYETTTNYHGNFVPRISFTKAIGDTNLKAMYTRAFRAPTIEQVSAGGKTGIPLKNETADVLEFEVGQRLSPRQYLTLNLFSISINRPIVYFFDDVQGLDTYLNQDSASTVGAELEYRLKETWGYVMGRYSFYRATNTGNSDRYQVPGHDDVFAAFPAHKFTLDTAYRVTGDLTLSTTWIVLGDRYELTGITPSGAPGVKRHHADFTANVYLLHKNMGWRGVDLGVGVFNIFNTPQYYLQPYNGGHNALPGAGREYLLRLAYTPGL